MFMRYDLYDSISVTLKKVIDKSLNANDTCYITGYFLHCTYSKIDGFIFYSTVSGLTGRYFVVNENLKISMKSFIVKKIFHRTAFLKYFKQSREVFSGMKNKISCSGSSIVQDMYFCWKKGNRVIENVHYDFNCSLRNEEIVSKKMDETLIYILRYARSWSQ